MLIVDGCLEEACRHTATGRAAALYGLDLLLGAHASADAVDHALEGTAEGKFHKAGVAHLADKAEHFRAGARGCAEAREPCASPRDDDGNVAPCLDVVD